ncbi:MAG: DinB family protein [Chitinophagaceae bacterium]|nr:DinB family protein [Chitinophagaceae bacterium]
MPHTDFIIDELVALLEEGNAHASFEKAVKGLTIPFLSKVPDGSAYSIWQLIEHIRIAQWDILEFSKGPGHKSPEWPDGYWPKDPAPPNEHAVKKSVQQVMTDRNAFIRLLHQAGENIYKLFPYGDGQSLFREALVIADHTSYHTGEIILLRRIMGIWH